MHQPLCAIGSAPLPVTRASIGTAPDAGPRCGMLQVYGDKSPSATGARPIHFINLFQVLPELWEAARGVTRETQR